MLEKICSCGRYHKYDEYNRQYKFLDGTVLSEKEHLLVQREAEYHQAEKEKIAWTKLEMEAIECDMYLNNLARGPF